MDVTPAKTAEPLAPALRGYLIVLASTLVLSTTGILVKFLLTDFGWGSFALAFWRVLLVSLSLGIILVLVRPSRFAIRPRHLPLFAFFGLVGVGLHQLVWITSVQLNGAGVATVLVYIQPAIVALISWRFLGEALDRAKIIALVLTLSGMVMVSRVYEIANLNLNALGLAAGFGTGFTWATYALLGRYAARHYSAWTSLWYAFSFGALFLLPLQFLAPALSVPGGAAAGWGVLLFLAVGPTLGGFGLYLVGLSHLPASVVTLIATLEPVLSVVLAYLLFGETLNLVQVLGAALILWSVIMLRPR
jgi:drug/metabolite transporter (DMT)-like permease